MIPALSRTAPLVTPLQDFENLSARQRLAVRPAYDLGWMWAEFGLDRPV
ncbi:MAG TPA: hypothetical protein VNL18_10930 [Gemmatimonadales bacterium]|nr:hypothetical protein [Gemmatimonadales bacterium]